jgi:hypothetical protein
MRAYDHHPDWEWITEHLRHCEQRVTRMEATVERLRPKQMLEPFTVALLPFQDFVTYGWAMGVSLGSLRDRLRLVAGWVEEALDLGTPENPDVQRALVLACMAGAWDTAARVGALVPDHLITPVHDPLSGGWLTGLARLAQGDHAAAATAARDMRAALDDPTVPPSIIELYATLTDLLAAAARDAAALHTAMTTRSIDLATRAARTTEDRRRAYGLLDTWGAATIATAHRDGIDLPDNPYLATDLIRAGA